MTAAAAAVAAAAAAAEAAAAAAAAGSHRLFAITAASILSPARSFLFL